jgi:hypothetical protein
MAADEEYSLWQPPFDVPHNGCLGTAGVGQQGAGRTTPRSGQDLFGNSVHGATEDGSLGQMDGPGQIEETFVYNALREYSIKCDLIPADADYSLRQPPALGSQSKRTADQSDADDAKCLNLHLGSSSHY